VRHTGPVEYTTECVDLDGVSEIVLQLGVSSLTGRAHEAAADLETSYDLETWSRVDAADGGARVSVAGGLGAAEAAATPHGRYARLKVSVLGDIVNGEHSIALMSSEAG
jgi:hypothetical protein